MMLLTENFNKQTTEIKGLQNKIVDFKSDLDKCTINLSK